MLDVKAAHLEILRQLLAQHVPSAEVWAYGSRVSGRAHEGSDLDLVLRDPTDLSKAQKDFLKLKSAFQESNLPFTVDVFDWPKVPEIFYPEIQKNHIVIQPFAQSEKK